MFIVCVCVCASICILTFLSHAICFNSSDLTPQALLCKFSAVCFLLHHDVFMIMFDEDMALSTRGLFYDQVLISYDK